MQGQTGYIIEFSIIALVYLLVTSVFYRRQPKVPSVRNRIFSQLMHLGLLFLVFDILSIVIIPQAGNIPSGIIHILNMMVVLFAQTASVLFFYYCLAMTGVYKRVGFPGRLLASIPTIIVFILVLLSWHLGRNGVFYINDEHMYIRGKIYFVLYINTALYIIASIIIIFLRRKKLRREKIASFLSFVGIMLLAMVIQYFYPPVLLNAAANAFALVLIYHILEDPSAHIDNMTGVFNRSALPMLIKDSYEQDKRYTFVIYSIDSLSFVKYSLSAGKTDLLVVSVADYIRATNRSSNVIRISDDVFAVLRRDGKYMGKDELSVLRSGIPSVFAAGSQRMRVGISVAAINKEDMTGAEDMLKVTERILKMHVDGHLDATMLADVDFRARMKAEDTLEVKLSSAVEEGRIEVFYQPIHDKNGGLTALEALVRIFDENGKMLPTQEAVEAAERDGLIFKLGDMIIRRVCEFISKYHADRWGLHHIGINLSALQCARYDLADNIIKITGDFDIPPSLIGFEITETTTASIPDIKQMMDRLKDYGFNFMLDDFGKGYANFTNITALPLVCVKIDKQLLWNVGSDNRDSESMALLSGIAGMTARMNLVSICEGVETEAQVELLRNLGIDMYQGYFYSKPLSPENTIEYVGNVRGAV